MPQTFTITSEEPNKIRNAGMYDTGALIRVQSSATESGAFADLSGTGSTPTIAVVADTRTYTAYDPNGAASTWYRTRYENAAATRTSDWSSAFQVAEESVGLLCSLFDVKQRLGVSSTDANNDETLLELIRSVSTAIEGYTGRWLAPRPTSGTTTYRVHTSASRTLWLPKGIRSVTTLGYATEDQPSSGGTYTTITSTDYAIEPPDMERDYGWPGTRIMLRSNGTVTRFSDALYGAEIVGAFGFASVPADISDIAANAVIRKWIGKERAEPQAFVGPSGGVTLLRDISPSDMARIDWYRDLVAA